MSTVLHFQYKYIRDALPLAGDEGALVMRPKRANVCWPMVFDGGFRLREADAETDGKCHRGKPVRARQAGDEGLSATGTNSH